MSIKFTIYKVTDADRTKKIVSVYGDYYELSEGGVDFFEKVLIPGGFWHKDTEEDRLVASLNMDMDKVFVAAETCEERQ